MKWHIPGERGTQWGMKGDLGLRGGGRAGAGSTMRTGHSTEAMCSTSALLTASDTYPESR